MVFSRAESWKREKGGTFHALRYSLLDTWYISSFVMVRGPVLYQVWTSLGYIYIYVTIAFPLHVILIYQPITPGVSLPFSWFSLIAMVTVQYFF